MSDNEKPEDNQDETPATEEKPEKPEKKAPPPITEFDKLKVIKPVEVWQDGVGPRGEGGFIKIRKGEVIANLPEDQQMKALAECSGLQSIADLLSKEIDTKQVQHYRLCVAIRERSKKGLKS